ncbi:MAG: hypothetical protein Q4C58_07600 [Eubacteriales bacterium]|nr:hypothetical protein [Eubacteriales bacterium]
MLYYFGKGKEFKKEDCKEYKTLEGARKAFDKAVAAGDEATVWDENGVVVIGMTDDVPEGALETNPDGSVNVYDADGNKVGTAAAATVAAATGDGRQDNADKPQSGENSDGRGNVPPAPENGQNEADTKPHEDSGDGGDRQQDDDNGQQVNVSESDTVVAPQGTMKVTVICDGTLNLRRSPHWGNSNVCGRASRGQSYYVKEIHTVNGKKMVRTIDDLYLSGASEHVQFEQL